MDRVPASASLQGRSFPLGATLCPGGVNFSVFSKHSTSVQLLLFDRVEDSKPARVIDLDPRTQRTYHYWHAVVPGIGPGQLYAFRADGPYDPGAGPALRPRQGAARSVRQVRGAAAWPQPRRGAPPGDNAASALKSVVVDTSSYDWEGDTAPRRPFAKTVIYEMHVAGFTRNPNSGVAAGQARHLCGVDRQDPVSSGPRRQRRRAAAGVRLRRAGCRARAEQLLGLLPAVVLRAASGLQLPARRARGPGRVPRHGQGAAPRRHRGHPRRGLQPHGRGRSHRSDAVLPRTGERDLLPARRGQGRRTPTSAAPATRSTPTNPSSAA